jgi:hypothetical protein
VRNWFHKVCFQIQLVPLHFGKEYILQEAQKMHSTWTLVFAGAVGLCCLQVLFMVGGAVQVVSSLL